jgi:NAD(P)-dependent dehydrogenase (short-subunit alcohol dehydrogenase family)
MPVAIVTGSDSGIGKATAAKLAERGFDIGITWRSKEDGADETKREVESHGRRAAVRHADFADVRRGGAVVAELADELGGIDVLVNNAGTGTDTPFLKMELDDWQRVIDVDLTAAFTASQEAGRRMMRAGGGSIVNVTSVHEHVPLPESAAYVVAKHGLGGLTKQMAYELAPHAITVNSVAPGEIATPMTGNEDVDVEQETRDKIPLGRPGDAREVASLISWLASPGSGYATGHSFVVDGGLLLMPAGERKSRPPAPQTASRAG